MELQCRCTACSAAFRVSAAAAGKKARCPKCSAVVDVPTVGAEAPAPLPPAPVKRAPPPIVATAAPPVQAAAPPPAKPAPVPQPAQATPPQPAIDFPGIVTTPAKAPKKSDLQFSFPDPAARDSSALRDNLSLSPKAETPVPAHDATSSSSDQTVSDFVLNRSAPTPKSAAPSPASGHSVERQGKKQNSRTPLLIGGGVLGLVVVLGIGLGITAMLGGFSGSGAKPKPSDKGAIASGKAILIFDWPEQDRRGSALSIDGKRMAVPAKGVAKFTLPAGSKTILLQRRGYENVETTLALTSGETSHFAPKWESIDTKIAGVSKDPSTKTSPPASNTGTNFPLGGNAAPESSPAGFPGWFQLVEVAQRQAKAGKKELLLVFGATDTDSDTKKLALDLADPAAKAAINASFVPVIIDFPQTAQGNRLIEDAFQNGRMAQLYGLREIPALVLADEEGHPYFIERQWKSGTNVVANLATWKQQRKIRDELLAAARATGDDAMRMAAAEKALNWLKERQFVPAFADDVRGWISIAQRVDAANTAGKLEAFVEADLQLRLQGVRFEDEAGILQAIAPLNEWTGKKRFLDPDRGASLHLLAAAVLLKMEKQEEGIRHLTEAASYEPKNKELKDRIAAAKEAIKNINIVSSGTGFVISESGYLLTNHHVVEGEGQVVVRIKGVDQPIPATVIAEDPNKDMALIKIEPPAGMKLTPIGLSNGMAGRGAAVIAFGYPLMSQTGQGVKLTEGVVSALPEDERNSMFLLDMRVNPGNSGGPLCDNKGNVVGMITAKTGRAVGAFEDTYGMAIPSPDLIKFLQQHLPKGAAAGPAVANNKLSTEEVDGRVSPAVILILKMK